jgi:hypothetical protein
MLILSLGVPRSGTILVFNMLREILERQGIPFRAVNTNYPETEAFLSTFDFGDNVLLHAHNVLPAVQKVLPRKDVHAFFNYRDPRDVVVSMMRLHDYSLDRCIDLTDTAFAQFQRARRFPRVMFIPYEHLITAQEAYVFRIAAHVGLFLGLDEAARVTAATSMERHRAVMQSVADLSIPVQTRRNPARVLRESTTHFINDRHIQSGKAGRWRDELTPDEQQRVTLHYHALLDELGMER